MAQDIVDVSNLWFGEQISGWGKVSLVYLICVEDILGCLCARANAFPLLGFRVFLADIEVKCVIIFRKTFA